MGIYHIIPAGAFDMEPRARISKEPGGSPASFRLLAR